MLQRPGEHGPLQVLDTAPGLTPTYPALQLEHAVAPDQDHLPAGQASRVGVGDVAAAWHAYPALQLAHAVACPAVLYCPAPHRTAVALVDPGGHT